MEEERYVRSAITGMVGKVTREGSNFYEARWPDGREYTVKKWDSELVERCECCDGTGYRRS